METKPGVRTTEFWVTVVTNVLSILNMSGAWNFTANKWSVLALAIVNAAYALARGAAKAGVSAQPLVAPASPVEPAPSPPPGV
jgi:hypothetical protein